jgi:hypothetical protein
VGSMGSSRCHGVCGFRDACSSASVGAGVLAAVLAMALFVPATASAVFTRPFERQIFRAEGAVPVTQPCSEEEAKEIGSPCLNPGGVAVNEANDLWVGNANGEVLDEFEPAAVGSAFVGAFAGFQCVEEKSEEGQWEESECLTKAKTNPMTHKLEGDFEKKITGPDSVAIESAAPVGNGDVYFADPNSNPGAVEVYEPDGTRVRTLGSFEHPSVAVDNSLGGCVLGECTVYVAESSGVVRLGSKGEAMPFECKSKECEEYVKGDEITSIPGRPHEVFGKDNRPTVLAVDAGGNIYAATVEQTTVYEYRPSGEFVQAFSLDNKEVSRICPQELPGEVEGVAVDPASGHLLVSVYAVGRCGGAIDEFDVGTGKFVAQISEMSSGAQFQHSAALAADGSGDVYLVDSGARAVDVWGPGAYFPTVTPGPAGGRTGSGAELHGVVNPAQRGNSEQVPTLAECYFQYVDVAGYEEALAKERQERAEKKPLTEEEGFVAAKRAVCESPGASEIRSEPEEDHAVHAPIAALQSGQTYRYRLVAVSGGPKGGPARTPALAFTAPHAPRIESVSAENVSSTFVDLRAEIDPLGAATSYHFEYDTLPYSGEERHGVSVPVPDASIGAGGPSGSSPEGVLQHVRGLAAGTTYHYRAVAENEAGVEYDGPEATLTTLAQPQTGPPDGRAYELVTPAEKLGGSDMFAEPISDGNIHNTSDDGEPAGTGEGFLLTTLSPFGAFPFAAAQLDAFSRDSEQGGWLTSSLAASALGPQSGGAPVANADLSLVAFADSVGSFASEEGDRGMDLLGPPGSQSLCERPVTLAEASAAHCYIVLHADPPVHTGTEEQQVETRAVGGSRDLEHVVLEGGSNACAGAGKVTHGHILCDWSAPQGIEGEAAPEPRLVNVNDAGEVLSACGADIAGGGGTQGDGLSHGAVSGDGSRVFFDAPDPRAENQGSGCWNGGTEHAPQLFVRVGGERTLEVSAPGVGVLEAGHAPVRYPVAYVGASEDGSRVFFVTDTWMTANHPEGHDRELYECQITLEGESPSCKLTRLSSGAHGSEAEKEGANVLFVPAVADDGSTVYFTAFGVLAAGASQYPTLEGEANSPVNLYRYDTQTGVTSYIAAVDILDHPHAGDCGSGVTGFGAVGPCTKQDWYTTADGRFLLFQSSLQVDGYNAAQDGCAEERLPGTFDLQDGRCGELYRYSVAAGERGEQPVVCVSCGGGGVDSAGNAEFARSGPNNGPAWGGVRAVSDDGSFVFFDSQGALVPDATNHTLDTYEWHEDLVTHARTVSLIGSGSDPAPTYFLGYSPYEYRSKVSGEEVRVEGGNVYIGTHAKLVPQDSDGLGNIFDARVCAPESPCIQPPEGATAQCEGGSCQTPPAAPNDATPSSFTFNGPGNLTSEPPPPPTPTAAEERAKHLAQALKACHNKHGKHKRVACEKQAHKAYGAKQASRARKASNKQGAKP